MDHQLINRFKMATLEKMLEICCELIDEGKWGKILVQEEYEGIRQKLENHNINASFNFYLWKKLTACHHYFNYLNISKKSDLKLKWMEMIVREIPDVDQIFEETHSAFDKYKKILLTYFR